MHDQLAGGGAREYGPYSEAARSDLRRQVLDFFDDATSGTDSLEPLQLASVTRQMRETLLAAKVRTFVEPGIFIEGLGWAACLRGWDLDFGMFGWCGLAYVHQTSSN